MIKEKDFVELDYTGKLEDGTIFDTTIAAKGKEAGLGNAKFGARIICVGEGQVPKGLEDAVIGKEKGTFSIDLDPEQAFGKKDGKLIQLIPTKKFLDAKIRPSPGLQVNVDGAIGVVKTVSGGRTVVDFNHPLAGRPVSYDVEIKRIVESEEEKVKALASLMLGDVEVTVEDDKARIVAKQQLPDPIRQAVKERITDLTNIKEVKF